MLARAASASSMWAANAATVAASADTADGRLRILPANLATWQHRALETRETARLLGSLFPKGPRIRHCESLPGHRDFGDEGAANHLRLSLGAAQPGWNVFVHAPDVDAAGGAVRRFVARQTEAQALKYLKEKRHDGVSAEDATMRAQKPEILQMSLIHI